MRPEFRSTDKETDFPLNQNRNNNRRRGRGGNRGQGGGNQGNRIDSRARGNAPQLLEKYKKLAHDASLNGDRVQTEYYLQFADHYFRVVADSRAQRDDQRPRRDEREDRDDRESAFDDPYDTEETEEPARGRRSRDDAPTASEEGEPGAEGEEGETEERNPFVRQGRSQRPRGRGKAANGSANDAEQGESEEAGLDAAVLPPSISRDEGEEPQPRARGRARRSRPADDGGEDTLEAVG
jgi:hypothetical protein